MQHRQGASPLNTGDEYPLPILGGPDARTGKLASIELTLSGTPGTVTTVTLPDWARGVRLSATEECRFAVGEDPAEQATSSATTVAAAAFAVGNVIVADQAEVRLLETGASRTLRLSSETASAVVVVEAF